MTDSALQMVNVFMGKDVKSLNGLVVGSKLLISCSFLAGFSAMPFALCILFSLFTTYFSPLTDYDSRFLGLIADS